jgi:hypothetical protein
MSRRWQTCILCIASFAMLVFATRLILVSGASTKPAKSTSNTPVPTQHPNKFRNLVLQPEAAAVNRRLGNRFKSANAQWVLVGQLTIGKDRLPLTIIRSQNERGENVEVTLSGRRFGWSDADGIKAIEGAAVTESERLAVERLVADSPDQFVLAQLRGASYQTIVRNLRPSDAGDDYTGPLWTMVRVDDPQSVEGVKPKSPWRLYFINSNSGLIDRIESDLDGQRVEASILQWTEQNGEKTPSHIRWTMNGRTLMEYQLTSFSQPQ